MKSKLFIFHIDRLAALLLAVLLLAACTVSPATPPPLLPSPTPIPPTMQPVPTPLSTAYPSARLDASMAYDSESDQVILFGGRTNNQNNFTELLETWTLDVKTNTWTQKAPAASPGCIFEPMVYDPKADRTIYYSGIKGSYPNYTGNNETWAYDANTNTWTNLLSANTPPAIADSKMAYDAESDKVIMFGGIGNGNINQAINETWVFDFQTNAWTQMKPATSPPGMGWPAMTYDSESDRVLVWGGWSQMMARPSLERTSLWAYDYNSNTWQEMMNADGPIEDFQGSMVYDPDLDRSFVYVGLQLWSYDYNNNHWESLNSEVTGPGRRADHAMIYDARTQYIILFGGSGNLSLPDNETWFYSPQLDKWVKAGP
jgi:hypothetical protein